ADLVKKYFSGTFALDASKIEVIRNGVDVESLAFIRHRGSVTDIGIVGNVNREVKRTDLFIRAAVLVAQNYPGVRWHVIGDGPLRGGLESLARELGIADKVIFAGRISDVPGYLDRIQIGVLCSDSEGLSNALIEYMFKGAVPVVTAVGGNPELVSDGVTG